MDIQLVFQAEDWRFDPQPPPLGLLKPTCRFFLSLACRLVVLRLPTKTLLKVVDVGQVAGHLHPSCNSYNIRIRKSDMLVPLGGRRAGINNNDLFSR